MAKINGRQKGAAGEREFCGWLYKTFELPEKPERNLEQVRSGGADVIVNPFAFEVKRCEKVEHFKWWVQVSKAVREPGVAFGLEPVVAYRINNGDWNFLISSAHIGDERGFIHLERLVFIRWVKRYLVQHNKHLEYMDERQRLITVG